MLAQFLSGKKVRKDPVYRALSANWGRQDICIIVIEVWHNLRMSTFGTVRTV